MVTEVNAMTPVTQADIDAALSQLEERIFMLAGYRYAREYLNSADVLVATNDDLALLARHRETCTALIYQRDADAAAVLSQTERLRVAVDDRIAETTRADKAERRLRELGEVVR